jgi:hypothetical protein
MKQQIIALYGHNLVLSIVGACLQQKPEFRIICIEGVPADYLKEMDTAYPQVVLFDLTLDTHFAALLARDYPEIVPIGIDLTRHKIWLPSGKLLHRVQSHFVAKKYIYLYNQLVTILLVAWLKVIYI